MHSFQVFIILLLFPLAFLTEQFQNFTIKVVILLFSVILLPIFFKAVLADLKNRFIPTILFLCFLAATTATTFFSIDTEQSILQLLLFYAFFVFFVSVRYIFPSLKDKENFLLYFLILTAILSMVSLFNIFINRYTNRTDLSFYWIYYGHNHLSALLVFSIPQAIYFLKKYWSKPDQRLFFAGMLSLLTISLFFTFSIGSIIALAASFVLILLLFKQNYIKVLLIALIFGLVSFLLLPETIDIKAIKFKKDPMKNLQTRLAYWKVGYEYFLQQPLTGAGLNTFHLVLANSDQKGKIRYTTNTHNFFIQMLTEGGIITFLSSCFLVISLLWICAKNALKDTSFLYLTLFSGVLASTLFSLIDLDWHLPLVFLFFWIFSGLSINYVKR